jgi:hypothetical protein
MQINPPVKNTDNLKRAITFSDFHGFRMKEA